MSTMQVHRLPNGRLSLEFAADQREYVLRLLAADGELAVEQAADLDIVTVAQGSFVLVHEWNEMALISTSRPGDATLQLLARQLGVDPAYRAPDHLPPRLATVERSAAKR